MPLESLEGKYEIVQKLGEGGMGAVYKVRHLLLEELRVVKVMRPRGGPEEEARARERFLREARLAVKLRHPNVAQLVDFSVDEDGSAYIVMEYVDGLTLQQILRSAGPPTVALAVEIAKQSLRAIHHLHSAGILHRDVSPDNLMVSSDPDGTPCVKLIDLGIARRLGLEDGLTQTGSFVGKYRYAAPERFDEEAMRNIDERADVYSFGVVLYELLTGSLPITGDGPSSLVAGHLLRPVRDFAETDPTNRVPDALREFVLEALEKEPKDRFSDAGVMLRNLEKLDKGFQWNAHPAEIESLLQRLPTWVDEAAVSGRTQKDLDRMFPPEKTAAQPEEQAVQMAADLLDFGDAMRHQQARRAQIQPPTRVVEDDQSATVEAELKDLPTESTRLAAVPPPPPVVKPEATPSAKAPVERTQGFSSARSLAQEMEAPAPVRSPHSVAVHRRQRQGVATLRKMAREARSRLVAMVPQSVSGHGAKVGVGALVVFAALLLGMLWLRPAAEESEPDRPALQVESLALASAPADQVVGLPDEPPIQETVSPALAAILSRLAEDDDSAFELLDSLTEKAASGELSQRDLEQLAALEESLERERLTSVVTDLKRGLARSDIHLLNSTLGGLTQREKEALRLTEHDRSLLGRSHRVAGDVRRVEDALSRGAGEEALGAALELRRRFPQMASRLGVVDRAAGMVEQSFDELVTSGQIADAREVLSGLAELLPEREGLDRRGRMLRLLVDGRQQFAGLVAAAERALADGQPDLGLRILSGAEAPSGRAAELRDLRTRLQRDLARLDAGAPTVRLDQELATTFRKGEDVVIDLAVADDYRVRDVRLRFRADGGSSWRELRATDAGGGIYRVVVPQALHGDRSFSMWSSATDLSGHTGSLGSAETPLEFKRKRWYQLR